MVKRSSSHTRTTMSYKRIKKKPKKQQAAIAIAKKIKKGY